jgi:hypothetical protein
VSGRTRTIRCLVSFIVAGAFALHQPAVANEPGPPPADGDQSEVVTAHPQTPGAGQSSFPLPVRRGIEFPERSNLTGALLPTSEGTIQIKKLRWGVDRGGFLIICSLSGYTRDGKPVSFTAPDDTDGCTTAASKSDIQKAPVAIAWGMIESFRFGTDQEGHLAFIDAVRRPAQRLEGGCEFLNTYICASKGCSGLCATPVGPLEMSADGTLLETRVLLKTTAVRCKCTGQTGSCVAGAIGLCGGECPERQSCELDRATGTCRCY